VAIVTKNALGGAEEWRSGSPYVAALASFLPPECIHLDAALDTVEVLDMGGGREKVRVAFITGRPVVADMLIGADGVNSAVRAPNISLMNPHTPLIHPQCTPNTPPIHP